MAHKPRTTSMFPSLPYPKLPHPFLTSSALTLVHGFAQACVLLKAPQDFQVLARTSASLRGFPWPSIWSSSLPSPQHIPYPFPCLIFFTALSPSNTIWLACLLVYCLSSATRRWEHKFQEGRNGFLSCSLTCHPETRPAVECRPIKYSLNKCIKEWVFTFSFRKLNLLK